MAVYPPKKQEKEIPKNTIANSKPLHRLNMMNGDVVLSP